MLAFFWACGLPVIEGFGQTETCYVVTNFPSRMSLGTAGVPARPEVEVKLSDEGEILVRSPMVMVGYFEQPEITAEALEPDGWLHTGDKGTWVDKPGGPYLAITGRVKEMIILNQCENVWPETLEGIFKRCSSITDCVMPMSCEGPGRQYLILLIAVARKGVTDAEIKKEMADVGRKAGIQPFEYPLVFVRVPEPFSVDNGMRNKNFKLQRKRIDETFQKEIDAAYGDNPSPSSAWVPS